MVRHLLLLIFISLVGCSATSTEITNTNNHINTPYYSITVPPNSGWYQSNDAGDPDRLTMSKTVSTNAYMMFFMTNWVVDESMKSWTEKELADNYRFGELNDMLIKGEKSGEFELNDVIISEEKVGNKTFYTMNYISTFRGIKGNSFLYLHFPKEKDFTRFFVSIYTEKLHSKSFKNDFLETLDSLKMIK